MKKLIVEVCAYALFMLFVYAGINKLAAFDFFLYDLSRSPQLGEFALPIALLVPASELFIAGMLIFVRTRYYGLLGSVFLMTAFTVYVGYVLSFTKDLPCSCGGIIRNLSWPQHMILNSAFLLIAIIGTIIYRYQYKSHYA